MLTSGPPSADQIEISVFGKGVGECSVAHIPAVGWIVIDSFLHQGAPIAETYLERVGVNLADVRLVALSHWHDDHIRGAAQLLRGCANARIAIPLSMKRDEFKGFLAATRHHGSRNFTSGVEELIACLDICADRGQPPLFCVPNRVLIRGKHGQEVESLSPSDDDISSFLNSIASIDLADVGRVPAPNRNDTSVALLVQANDNVAMFGGDLERRSPGSGWFGACDAWTRPGKAKIVKVPHHGSPNAYHAPMWQDHVEPGAIAIIAPYARGRRKLPQPSDIEKIKEHGVQVILAACNDLTPVKHPNRQVAKEMGRSGVKVRRRGDTIGVVRFRHELTTDTWVSEIEGTARVA